MRAGVRGTGMGGVSLPARQIWQLITYLRSRGQTREEAPISGDPARGRLVFLDKADCAACHRVSGQGGRRGLAENGEAGLAQERRGHRRRRRVR